MKTELLTQNPRIKAVYGTRLEDANIEHTLPAVTVPWETSPLLAQDDKLRRVVEDNLRVVVTPTMLAALPAELKGETRTMSSPFECGRLVEANHTFEIDGKPHTLNFKGVGATSALRNGRIMFAGYMSVPYRLREYPFYDGYGELFRKKAEDEMEAQSELAKRGVDTEKVLGIYQILNIPNQYGNYVRPEDLRPGTFNGIPVILARASQSNFRLLDSVTMYERGMRQHIPRLRDMVLGQYAISQNVEAPTMEDYLQFISAKVIGQEMPLIAEGYEMCSGGPMWKNLARNVSVLGEELDLEAVGVVPGFNDGYDTFAFDYIQHVETQFGNIDETIKALADTLSLKGQKADFNALADHVWKGTTEAMGKLNTTTLFETLPPVIGESLGWTSPESVVRSIYEGITRHFYDFFRNKEYQTPYYEGVEAYRRRMIVYLDQEKRALFGTRFIYPLV